MWKVYVDTCMVPAISQVAVDGTSHHHIHTQRGNFSHMEDHEKIKGVPENGN
ncbi:hypothetical protein H5410_018176 [Solanum commersonii]|uniref:Uncharacterized protein n=1 Tax=Solanum commersonii TaxID=4109 RepID=A0A9J6A1M1_SOLCO|nr:hypothetical protein H5410_018176 [Solanum commersonii]